MSLATKCFERYMTAATIAAIPIGLSNGFKYEGERNLKQFCFLVVRTTAESAVFPYTAYKWMTSDTS
ncbi:hypothetical protein D1R32_gp378 [Tunisvirus fontaine2]|uniref:Uncharacterized protein n=1 Tax=Tunisvirus fontaine2 TaxID=1421067 RepID=V9SEF3_9VIRU|nr:hypothetical protein D1R32_gp378 [Tunisvirus fontaine2]AHC55095.1 hypothetical protein TNS_ORF377 [Tunisvirus fontaine2]